MDVADAMRLAEKIYRRLDARRPEVEKFEDYYEGKQPLTFATEEWRAQNAERYAGFSDNWCAPIVNAEAERASIGGIAFFGEKERAKAYWETLRRNRFELQFSQAVVATLSAKRSYAMVWGDADTERPLVSFEHASMVEVQYDWENPQKRVAALKSWVDEETEYGTLYTPSQVFKFKRPRIPIVNDRDPQADQAKPGRGDMGGWEPRYPDDSDYILVNPLGVVPVVEFQNRPMLRGNPQSEIQGAVPMQDSINLLWAYLMLAADYASMDARVILGADPPKIPILDNQGNIIGSRPVDMKDLREKRILSITGDNAKIDSWKAAALDIFTDTIEIAVGHIAAQTRTPPHYLVANKGLSNLSGEALQASEAGLVTKVREFRAFTDDSLREMLRLMALVENDADAAELAPLAQFHWDRIEVRSDAQVSDAMSKDRTTGYPFEYLLEKYGHSPSEIERIMAMKRQEDADMLGMGVQSAVQDAMNNDGAQ